MVTTSGSEIQIQLTRFTLVQIRWQTPGGTVGPWRAAGIFVGELEKAKVLDKVATLKITLYGSLAATGKGHATVEAILMGAQGYDCETVDTSIVRPNFQSIIDTKTREADYWFTIGFPNGFAHRQTHRAHR